MLKTKNKTVLYIFFVLGFFLMLFMNVLTPRIADDFLYRFSFKDDSLITSVAQIFPSMQAHAEEINGRIFAHFCLQLFDFLPPIVFDIVNSLFFVLLVFLINRITSGSQDEDTPTIKKLFFLAVIFSALWIFPLVFANAFLIMCCACNYLWGSVIGLAFMIPYVDLFNQKEVKYNPVFKVLFIIFSGFAGGWLENVSSAIVFLAVLILFVSKFWHKKQPELFQIIAIVAAFGGFLFMALAPAELGGKIADFYIWDYVNMFKRAISAYGESRILIFSYITLLVCAVIKKARLERIILSLVFILGSLFSNFILIFGLFMPPRTSTIVVIFLIIANVILLKELTDKISILAYSSSFILIAACIYWVFLGGIDAVKVYSQIKTNDEYIISCVESGMKDIKIPLAESETKYAQTYVISTDDTEHYANRGIAKYYGLNSILGEDNVETEETQEE